MTGFRIQRRRRREASSVILKYKEATGRRKKQELNSSVFTLSILVSELLPVGKIEDEITKLI